MPITIQSIVQFTSNVEYKVRACWSVLFSIIFCWSTEGAVAGELPVLKAQPKWQWTTLGSGIGLSIIDFVDLDSDGSKEMLVSGGGALFVLESNLEVTRCFHVLEDNARPYDFAVLQADADPAQELIVATSASVALLDGRDCSVQERHFYDEGWTAAIALGDVSGDGVIDAVFHSNSAIMIAPWNDLATAVPLPLPTPLGGHYALQLVEFDEADGLDIIYVNTSNIFVVNGLTFENVWTYEGSQTYLVSTGQVIPGGNREIAMAHRQSGIIELHSTSSAEPLWVIPANSVNSVHVVDMDLDGDGEVVVGRDHFIDVIDAQGNQVGQVGVDHAGSGLVSAEDIDGDGAKELFFGIGHATTLSDHLVRGDPKTGSSNIISVDVEGRFRLAAPMDYDANGEDELAFTFARHDDIHLDSVRILDLDEGTFVGSYAPIRNRSNYATAIVAGNVDEDLAKEICLGSLLQGNLVCLDGATLVEEWQRDIPYGVRELMLADVDLDGTFELVADVYFNNVVSYDAINGWLKAVSPLMSFANTAAIDTLHAVGSDIWVTKKGRDDDEILVNYAVSGVDGSVIPGPLFFEDVEQLATSNGKIFAAIREIGVVLIDPVQGVLSEPLYRPDATVQSMLISENGHTLLVGEGSRSQLRYSIFSLNGNYRPYQIEPMYAESESVGKSHLAVVTEYGVKVIALPKVFESGFE